MHFGILVFQIKIILVQELKTARITHTLKLKNSKVIIIKDAKILAYMNLNSSWKINPNGPLYVDLYEVHSKLTQKP